MTSQTWWYSARAGGIVAWALLSAATLWGLLLSTKLRPPRIRPNWTLDLHRFLGGLAVIFTAVHVVSILFDSFVQFSVVDVLVPFRSSWHPVAVAWGIVALYFLLAVELTSLARNRLAKRTWRRVHYLSFPLFVIATVHLLAAGTDANAPLMELAVIVVCAAVLGLTGWRVYLARQPKPARPSVPRAAARPPA